MKNNNLIVVYLIIFISVLILLRTVEIIEVNNEVLLGYVLIIYGLSLYYYSFIKKKKFALFIGSSIFLAGVLFLVIGSFEFQEVELIILPSVVLILAISSFMIFLSDTSNRTSLYAAIILFTSAIGIIAILSTKGLENFILNTVSIAEIYWPILIILIVVIILVERELKDKKE